MEVSELPDRIKNRYFRKVMAHPEGAVVHDGDCSIWRSLKVCTCGLIHDLMWIDFKTAEEIYPKFGDERVNLDAADHLFQRTLPHVMQSLKEATPETAFEVTQESYKHLDDMLNPKPLTPEEIKKREEEMHKWFREQGWKKSKEDESPE